MKTMENACKQLAADLEQVGKAVETTREEFIRFDKNAVYWPVAWIDLRLRLLELTVTTEAVQQLLNHHGAGIACIMTKHDGNIFVTWHTDEPLLIESRDSWEAPVTTLTEKQFRTFMNQLLKQLHEGEWEPAVTWLQSHGKSVAPLKLL